MDGNSPYPHGYASPQSGGGPLPGPSYGPQPANIGPAAVPRRQGGRLLAVGVVLAVLLGVAALVLSIIGVTRESATLQSPTPAAQRQELFVEDADKALCEAISPLMREQSDRTRNFQNKGDAASPERLGAIPGYKAETLDWANRIQSLLNQHAEPPRYLTRTLQRYIDGMLLYSENMYPERGPDSFDNTTYESAIVDYGGPLGTCYKVGIRW